MTGGCTLVGQKIWGGDRDDAECKEIFRITQTEKTLVPLGSVTWG